MKLFETGIADLYVIEPEVYSDERGFFYESYNKKKFDKIIDRKVNFIQDNHSKSSKGTLRGLHYQTDPMAQAKLVRCIKGSIFDVAVDLRKNSSSFGKWYGLELSSTNSKQLWIPEGFAHGFISLEEDTEIIYKTNNYYSKENEKSICWNDEFLSIAWPIAPKTISKKDIEAPNFSR